MNRRSLLSAGLSASALAVFGFTAPVLSQDAVVNAILNDPEAPVGGNPNGDVTIVAFLDYNCPFCKQSAPELEKIIRADGNIRLVYKDWPILTPTSIYGAQLALAANYQGAYERAHKALMSIPGHGISKDKMLEAVKASGVDTSRLEADLVANDEKINAILKRNLAQADSLGLQGTPTYLVGPFQTSTLDYDGFKQVVADARARQAKH